MQKQSSLAALGVGLLKYLGAGTAVHMAQNQIAKKIVPSDTAIDLYKHHFHSGRLNINPSPKQALKTGLATVVVPEVGVASGMLKDFGSHVESSLKDMGTSFSKLETHERGFIKNVLGGDFSEAISSIKKDPSKYKRFVSIAEASPSIIPSDHFRKLVSGITQKGRGDTRAADTVMKVLTDSATHDSETLNSLSKEYKKSYFSKIFPPLFDSPSISEQHELSKGSISPNKKVNILKKNLHLLPEVGAYAAIVAHEPAAVGLNVLKRTMGSETFKSMHPKIRSAMEWASNKVLYNPMKKEFQDGLQGTAHTETALGRFIKRDLINPVDYNIASTVGNIGKIIGKSPEYQTALNTKDLHSVIKDNQAYRTVNNSNLPNFNKDLNYYKPVIPSVFSGIKNTNTAVTISKDMSDLSKSVSSGNVFNRNVQQSFLNRFNSAKPEYANAWKHYASN